MLNKLNYGCGTIQPDNWINCDIQNFGNNLVGDTRLFNNDQFDYIVSHATVCAVQYNNIDILLKEFYRILKPNGVIRISLPDIVLGFNNYINNNIEWFPNSEKNIDERFSHWLTWYSTSASLFTTKAFINKMNKNGFNITSKCNYKQSVFATDEIYELDTRENEFFFIEAKK